MSRRRSGGRNFGVGLAAALALLVAGLLWSTLGQSDRATTPDERRPTVTSSSPTTGSVAPRDQEQVGTDVDPQTGLAWVRLEQLPPEAAETVALIESGGPFPYRQDGAVFNNFEGLLPEEPRGHYREYTVPTPGEDDRGARRIVTGEDDTVFFWTADHYDSFERIAR